MARVLGPAVLRHRQRAGRAPRVRARAPGRRRRAAAGHVLAHPVGAAERAVREARRRRARPRALLRARAILRAQRRRRVLHGGRPPPPPLRPPPPPPPPTPPL